MSGVYGTVHKRKLTLAVGNLTDAATFAEEQVVPGNPIIGTYILGDLLGKGTLGGVFRSINSETGEFVAVKQMELKKLQHHTFANLRDEIERLKTLDHPNLVRFIDVINTTTHLSLIIEYCESGSLASIVDNFGSFPEQLTALYIAQCLRGLAYLHQFNVVHKDIKGANVLITKSGQVKLTDFGISKRALTAMGENIAESSPYWLAPELIKNQGEVATTASDVWSLGCTVIELYTGAPPFFHLAPTAAVLKIIDSEVEIPMNASPEMQDFLRQCICHDPSKRLSALALFSHPWIQKYNPNLSLTDTKTQIDTADMLKTHVTEAKDVLPSAEIFRRMSLTPDLGGEAPLPSESRVIIKVYMPTLDPTSEFKTLYVSDRTDAKTIVSVALSKINKTDDSSDYYICERISTGEERRFEDNEFPMDKRNQYEALDSEFQYHVKRKSPPVKEGFLKMKKLGRFSFWSQYYFVLDRTEKYFAFYDRIPTNRSNDQARDSVWSLRLIEAVDHHRKEPTWFYLFAETREWLLQANSDQEKIEWMNELRYASQCEFDLGIFD